MQLNAAPVQPNAIELYAEAPKINLTKSFQKGFLLRAGTAQKGLPEELEDLTHQVAGMVVDAGSDQEKPEFNQSGAQNISTTNPHFRSQ